VKDVLENLAKLPEQCAVVLEGRSMWIFRGGREAHVAINMPTDTVDQWNARRGITPAQVKAMIVGVTLGWDMDGADPDTHAEATEESKVGSGPFTYEYDTSIDVVVTVEAMNEQLAVEAAREKLRNYLSEDRDWPSVRIGSDINELYLLESTDPREA